MTDSTSPTCLVCQEIVEIKLAIGRKSGKPSLSMVCPVDARHFRGFINDKTYVENVLSHHSETHRDLGDQSN
ncbi:MAG: hypothetical protein HQ477_06295 [Chloroflexi bacterium]|nr:hypothetical protein [Chloroflexota bacterium]